MASNPAICSTADGSGVFNYLDDTVIPSLYRNGRVLTRRDPDGSDGGMQGVNLAPYEIAVTNARLLDGASQRTLKANGFELLDSPFDPDSVDFFNHEQVIRDYYPECARIISEHTGGIALAFDHNVRSALGKQSRKRITGGQQVQGPAHVVHGDYTLTSAPQRLRDMARPPGGNDTLAGFIPADEPIIEPERIEAALADGGRFAIINLWRNITDDPVAVHPLALCDGQSVQPEDLVVFEIHYQDRIGENYFAKHAQQHEWFYYPAMTRDEALLIKQWDSAGELAASEGARADASDADAHCTFSFHSAFEDSASPPDAPDRWSIEVRCMVLFDS